MHWCAAILAITATAGSISNTDLNVPNANHIFNAIHDSMRQFGNSLNHNGMSIFLATVPKDIELYHGTSNAYRINGTEWLAFEPEHALIFARGRMAPPPKDADEDRDFDVGRRTGLLRSPRTSQIVLDDKRTPPPRFQGPGYLHTYRTKHDLRLLYVDGQSAAKSSKGTLDVQDSVLLREPPSNVPGEWLPFDDLARARSLCRTAKTEWQDKIDGVIRMEAGFEIVLCNFEKDLDVVKIAQAKVSVNDSAGEMNEDIFNYYKAISARYDGIGGDRVSLDYDNFLTMFNHPGIMYYDNASLPRVDNTSKAIPSVRYEVKELALKKFGPTGVNWQSTTDMIVARYADRIAYLTSGAITNLSSFQAEVDRALRPFIDYGSRNSNAEIHRCAFQLLPRASNPPKSSLAYNTILNVTTTICSALSSVLSEDINFTSALTLIKTLQSWLRWTEWKKCRGCNSHEVCFLPIWPTGTEQDFEQPRCRSDISGAPGGYWWDDFR